MIFYGLLLLVGLLMLMYWLANTKAENVRGFFFGAALFFLLGAVITTALMGRYLLSIPLLMALWTGWRRLQMVRGAYKGYQAFKDKVSGSDQAQSTPPPQGDTMDRAEALNILGLKDPIDKSAVNKAFQKLMQKVHPDHGGNDYLAMKLNMARDLLLKELSDR